MGKTIKPFKDKGLTEIFFKLGIRSLILVEGDTDQEILEDFWFEEEKAKIMFYDTGGIGRLEQLQKEIAELKKDDKVYAIKDRDFQEQFGHVGNTLTLFFYTIENYLLQPEVLYEEFKIYMGKEKLETEFSITRPQDVEKKINDWLNGIIKIVATNWLISERIHDKEGYMNCRDNRDPIEYLCKQLKLSKEEAEKLLQEKINKLIPFCDSWQCDSWQNAYQKFSGKLIIDKIYLDWKYKQDIRQFKRSLAHKTKNKNLIRTEITEFIEKICVRQK